MLQKATDERIRRMYTSQIQSTQADFDRRARDIETAITELAKEIGLWRVALEFGFVFDVDDFLSALGGPQFRTFRQFRFFRENRVIRHERLFFSKLPGRFIRGQVHLDRRLRWPVSSPRRKRETG